MHEDFDRCYRAVQSKDARFDGWFVTAVLTTKIYCRPSCPVRPPFARNMRFYPTAAAAQRAGFRACKRCRPDASPGSPEWNVRGDVVARAMRLIADGTVDREGVTGLAARVGYTTRQLERLLQAEVGANPLALARAQRSQTARVLIETTDAAVRRRRVRRGLLEHPPVQRHGPDGVRSHAYGTAPTRAHAIRTWRRRAPRVRCHCGCRCGRRSPTRDCSAISRRVRCPVSRKCATARTDGRCGCPTATES